MMSSPDFKCRRDKFRAIVNAKGVGLGSMIDELIEGANDSGGWQAKINLNGQGLSVKIVHDIEGTKRSTRLKRVRHKVHGPAMISTTWDLEWDRMSAWKPLFWLNPTVQIEGSVDPSDPFMIPSFPLKSKPVNDF